jgi:ribosome biogenesis protein ENP2
MLKRVPKMPRCIDYNPFNCDLYIGCSSSSLYRLNLEKGRFLQSYSLSSDSCNKTLLNPGLNCLLAGGDSGDLDIIDLRVEGVQGSMGLSQSISCLSKSPNPFEFYVGTGAGVVHLFDIRHSSPILTKHHPYEFPILSIEWHSLAKKLVSVDKKCIRVTEKDSEDLFFMYEPKYEINNLKSKNFA